jgi:hypothetical protein
MESVEEPCKRRSWATSQEIPGILSDRLLPQEGEIGDTCERLLRLH